MAYTLNPFSGHLDYYKKGTTPSGLDATKIRGRNVSAADTPNNGESITWDNNNSEWHYTMTSGVSNHSELNELDYASSGHAGFQPAGNYLTDAEFSTYSGTLQTQIDDKSDVGHTHDSRYYTESEHINVSAGAGDAGKPIVLDTDGNIDASMINDSDIAHGSLTGKDADDHTQYTLVDGTRAFSGTVGGITPTDTAHLTTKGYVDSLLQGLDWQESVLSRTVVGSATQTLGNRYISTSTAGGWTIHHIYEWNGTSWDDIPPTEGFASWVEDEDVLYVYNGSNWVKFGNTVTHDNLNAVDSGTYRHLSAAQVTDLTDSNDCSIHKHDDRYYTESEVNTISGSLSSEIDSDITTHETTYNHAHYDIAYTHSQSAHAPANADNTAANETSHADVVVDGDFGSDGFLKRSGGVGSYTVDTNNYYTESEVDTISGSLNNKITNENLWDRTGTTLTTHSGGDNVKLDNDVWYSGQNYADSEPINIVKVNEDDEINVGAAMNVGPIEGPADGGAIVGIDMPVTDGTSAGDEMSISYRIDGDNFIKMYSEADGVGGIQNSYVEVGGRNEVTTTVSGVATTCGLVTLDLSTVYRIEAVVLGRETDDTNRNLYHLEGLFYRAAGGAVQQGATTSITTIESDAIWACVFDINGNDVRVRVTGAAATINWITDLTVNKVS